MLKSSLRATLAGSLSAIGLAALPAPPAHAATTHFYVAEGGTDSGTCASVASPCLTVSYALALVEHEATVHVSGTIHDEIFISGLQYSTVITGEDAASPAVLDGAGSFTVVSRTGGALRCCGTWSSTTAKPTPLAAWAVASSTSAR
ncbi:hypothetical protein F0U44_05970 [Nocardioides humilatus]|uniref:Uncharacterized protein n=1 Tax=Nocardioides humilatus TaxID=2607660 RepID=A0A5B1LMS7_9ACTN|nr:hypothetical protein [Nocardioides humilatus]KAA1421814.1 hypothetical protein F0U44_05970 [Nocardioides humilatus]